MPIGLSRATRSEALKGRPSRWPIRAGRTATLFRSGRSPRASSRPRYTDTPPGVMRSSSSQNRSSAIGTSSWSVPRSKRIDASERRPSRWEVRLIDRRSHHASSSSTVVVPSLISVLAPPITPEMPMGRSSRSTIRPSPGSMSRSVPSSVTRRSPPRCGVSPGVRRARAPGRRCGSGCPARASHNWRRPPRS